jgi:hypothetical protein
MLVWKTKKEMEKELDNAKQSWKKDLSRDGFIISAEGEFEYKGIAYLLKVIRYYTLDEGFTTMGNRKSDSHVVVEYPEKTKIIKESLKPEERMNFLYHDTMNNNFINSDNKTLKYQIRLSHIRAKQDIDDLLDGKTCIETDVIKLIEDI